MVKRGEEVKKEERKEKVEKDAQKIGILDYKTL